MIRKVREQLLDRSDTPTQVELRGLQLWPLLHIERASERIAKAALMN